MHFLVIVFGDDVDAQLEPFQEGGRDVCPQEYLVFEDVEDESRAHYLTGVFDGPLALRQRPEDYGKPLREVFPSFDDYMLAVHGERDEVTGRYGDWYNPHAQYDWYEVGGRFTGHLALKTGRGGPAGRPGDDDVPGRPKRADEAVKGDIDFEVMSREGCQKFVPAWFELERTGQTSDRSEKWDHDIPETITTREERVEYARSRSGFTAPDAVVVNGEWFGPWWVPVGPTVEAAARWEDWYASLLASLPEDTLLTVIDCHT
jgi:hypothetical protein